MKKILLALLVPLVVSATAVAAPSPASTTAHCKNLQRQAPALFGAGKTYADLAACVAAKTTQTAQTATNAARTCKAEEAKDAAAFELKYNPAANGKGKGHSNALGACVSATAKTATATQQTAELNAAKKCKAERADAGFAAAHEGKSFADFYGTKANKKNAFGKCVSKIAKAQQSQ